MRSVPAQRTLVPIRTRTSGVTIEKSNFSTVARWSRPSKAGRVDAVGLAKCYSRSMNVAPQDKVVTLEVILRDDHGDLDSEQIEC